MILLSLDFETTGLDRENDEVIEVGAILYTTNQKKCLESAGYLVKPNKPISQEITNITGITQAAANKFGFSSQQGLENLVEMAKQADAIVGQNIIRFDKPFFDNWCRKERVPIIEKLYIDTRTDLPGVESKSLSYMAADHGFLNLFPHSALADAQTVLKLVSMYNIDEVKKLAESSTVVLIGQQDRADNSLAKKRKFAWNGDYKIWWKAVKECQVDTEISACPFHVSKAGPEIMLEKLWYS